MTTYLLRRLWYALAILIGVNLLTFFLFFTVNTPDDMARLNIGGKRVTQEQIDKWKAERGYDRPLYWNAAESGSAKLTRTVLWERSVSLMALQFGRSDSARSVDIGHEVRTRMWVSLQLALPLFILQLIVSIGFSLLLVFFRHSRIDFWGVVLCVVMLSISSLFYIIVGQFLFSRVLRLVPISGYAGGLDAVRFLLLPVFLSLLSRLGSEARLYRAMFLEEIGKRLCAHRARQGLERAARARPSRAAQRADPDHHQRRLVPAVRVSRQPGVRELLRHPRARRVRDRGDQRPGLRDRAHDGVPERAARTSRATC